MTETCKLTMKRGSLFFSRADCDRFFPGADAVVLLREGESLLIVPIRQASSGGYLLKQRNLAGDRVAHAAGFLREQGFDDEREHEWLAEWSDAKAGLRIAALFSETSSSAK